MCILDFINDICFKSEEKTKQFNKTCRRTHLQDMTPKDLKIIECW